MMHHCTRACVHTVHVRGPAHFAFSGHTPSMTIVRAGFARINAAGKVSVTSRRTADTRQRTLDSGQQTADSGQTSHVPRPTRSRPAKFVTGPCQSPTLDGRVPGLRRVDASAGVVSSGPIYGIRFVGYGIWDTGWGAELCRPHPSQCARHTFMPQSQSQSMSKSMRWLELWLWLWSAPEACNEPHSDCPTAARGYQAPGSRLPPPIHLGTGHGARRRMVAGDGRRRL